MLILKNSIRKINISRTKKKERIAHFNQLSVINWFESRENMIHYFGEEKKKKNRESIPGNENEINLTKLISA